MKVRFQRRPTVIEAEQYLGGVDTTGVCALAHGSVQKFDRPHLHTAHEAADTTGLGQIVYLEVGDWIVPESQHPGRFYPVKNDVMNQSYERLMVEDTAGGVTLGKIPDERKVWVQTEHPVEMLERLRRGDELARDAIVAEIATAYTSLRERYLRDKDGNPPPLRAHSHRAISPERQAELRNEFRTRCKILEAGQPCGTDHDYINGVAYHKRTQVASHPRGVPLNSLRSAPSRRER